MVLHISPFNSTPLSQHGVQDGLILVRQSELEDLRAGRRKLLQRVKRLQKQRSRDKAKLLRLRVQLEAQPLKRIFPFKTKCGVITEATRDMIRELVALGVPHRKIRHASEIVLAAAGFATEGNFDRHSVARIVREGYVAAAMHIMHEVSEAKSWTGSADGTGHKHVEHLSHFMYVTKPVDDSSSTTFSPILLNLGVHSATGKTSEIQLEVLKELLAEYLDIYNSSPLGEEHPLALADVLAKLAGWGTSDHAEDQKKFFRLLSTWKQRTEREQRGTASLQTMMDKHPSEYLDLILRATDDAICTAGGPAAWEALLEHEQEDRRAAAVHDVQIALGEAAFGALSDEERSDIDLFVWAGCAMHKEQNSVKGGATALKEYWKAANVQGPCPLMNRDRASIHAQLGPSSDAAKLVAETSEGGAVKLTTLAGAIFNHHDDKKGQQDVFRIFMEHAIGYIIHFPETSNTRFGTHGSASAELVVHHPMYVEFLEFVRDDKEKQTLNNMEANVLRGLQDIPTITELAVLALYSQAVSHPYMRIVRGESGIKNALTLGPVNRNVLTYCQSIITNPALLLGSDASYITGSLDGHAWERPEVFYSVQALSPKLPHLQGDLVAFFTGALDTWRRFTSEFASGSIIESLTAEQCARAAVRATNDHNESNLGALRVRKRKAPNKSELTYNAETMFAANKTSIFVRKHISTHPGNALYIRKLGRKLDGSGLGKQKRCRLMVAKQNRVHVRREKRDIRAAVQEKKKALIDGVAPILDADYWRDVDRRTITVEKHIKPQLYWHQRASPAAKVTVTGKKDHLLEVLISAIEYYNLHNSTECDNSIPLLEPTHSLSTTPVTATVHDNTTDTDSEYDEEELFHA
ncbi:hypothetical protein FOMPIDRAFT_1136038 [Fomitopsis schrenkii]|uniref:Uncharacterized protein n=1 Tax=Fomitopsis schrenkii TaxID=2126942 RepID=S8DIV5_FOMSC|nr:hypothetical protein FOMPIDRAFT_1136038 [Fomitopsis schrenkii]